MKEKPYNGPLPYPVQKKNPVFAERLGKRIYQLGSGGRTKVMRKTGIAVRSLEEYMAGRVCPSLATAIALADMLGVSLDWLAGRTDEERRE